MSIFFPNLQSLDPSSKLSKEESIAALIMLGWELVLPNLLIKPHTFRLSASIGIMEDDSFIFINDKTGTIQPGDEIKYTHREDEFLLTYSASTMVQVVMDNTNG